MVTPRRKKNIDIRPREHLTPPEMLRLIDAASKVGRYGKRDALMIRMAYVHGMRASELTGVMWTDVDFDSGCLLVRRLKRGKTANHPMTPDVIRLLKKMPGDHRGFIFVSERGDRLSANGFNKIVGRAGEALGLGFTIHAHMLRHSCGYKLVNDRRAIRNIQEYLGHTHMQETVRYTALAPGYLAGCWKD